MLDAHVISSYFYIFHYGEEFHIPAVYDYTEDGEKILVDNERNGRDKDHFHLRFVPNKRVDKAELIEFFTQYLPDQDPIKPHEIRESKEGDALLYFIHLPAYMRLKYPNDTAEKIPYQIEDIKTSGNINLDIMFRRAMVEMQHTAPSVQNQLMSGVKPSELIQKGESVFMVNNILKLLERSEFQRVSNELGKKSQQFDCLRNFLYSLGYRVEILDDNQLIFEKIGDNIKEIS